ncbi:hypothetical protein A374_01459 [Fictibacillus macauensis ZFHKF-1]|uniref:Knr4/Smi1-like domain-containing protein n=1 Tax=Fictibacillus macauensis ZFHKF-1 TaxID=1196324 RepID=I8J5X4_9BACL|nr:SMI1/KNR4 family protein [Fictibacillus macauensis]EIT87206.1 hypothetical protein A374_01459 [Fictibacillus macauensis ZFHKF-1]
MNNYITWKYREEEVSEAKVVELGQQLGFQLPQDYIDCVKVNGGASVEPESFMAGTIERCFGGLFRYDDEENVDYIVKVYEDYQPSLPEKIFPFADDPAGNLICFDYSSSETNPFIVFWDHEGAWEKEAIMEEEGLTSEEAEVYMREQLTYVAASFTELLESLRDSEG